MSKLKKAIERAGRRESTPMGFTRVEQAKRRAMLLCLTVSDEKGIETAKGTGADVVFVQNGTAETVGRVAKAAEKLPVGAIVENLTNDASSALAEAGADFISSPFGTTVATAVDTGRSGHVIGISEEHDDATLRALGPIGLDALLVDRGPDSLTLQQQARFVRLAQLTGTPLLFRVDSSISVDELRVLRDSGGAGVVLGEGASKADIEALSGKLQEVPDPKRREGGPGDMAVLPALLGRGHEHDDEEEPDDE